MKRPSSNQITREMLTDEQYQRVSQLFEMIRQLKAKLRARAAVTA